MKTNFFIVYTNKTYCYCEYEYNSNIDFCTYLEDIISDYVRFIPIPSLDNIYMGVNEFTSDYEEVKVIVKANCGQAYKNEEFEYLNSEEIEKIKVFLNEDRKHQ